MPNALRRAPMPLEESSSRTTLEQDPKSLGQGRTPTVLPMTQPVTPKYYGWDTEPPSGKQAWIWIALPPHTPGQFSHCGDPCPQLSPKHLRWDLIFTPGYVLSPLKSHHGGLNDVRFLWQSWSTGRLPHTRNVSTQQSMPWSFAKSKTPSFFRLPSEKAL